MNPAILGEFINEILIKSGILGSDKSFIAGMTRRQVHIILEINRNIYRHGELASRLGVEPSTLTRTINPLVKDGYVDRDLNPDNRREILIRLSNKGLSVLKEINQKMSRICSQILEHVPTSQLETVETSILLLLNSLKQTHFEHE